MADEKEVRNEDTGVLVSRSRDISWLHSLCPLILHKLSEPLQMYHNSTQVCVHAAEVLRFSYAELQFHAANGLVLRAIPRD